MLRAVRRCATIRSVMQAQQGLFHGLFHFDTGTDGQPQLSCNRPMPASIPCPTSGHLLRVSTVEAGAPAICPSCASHGAGGFVSFEGDLRMAYACPVCRQLVWLPGA